VVRQGYVGRLFESRQAAAGLQRARLSVHQAQAEVTREFEAQYPQCGNVLLGMTATSEQVQGLFLFLSAECCRLPKAAERIRIKAWLKVHMTSADARLVLAAVRGNVARRPPVVPGADTAVSKKGQAGRCLWRRPSGRYVRQAQQSSEVFADIDACCPSHILS